jgi:hypothetical protein
MSRRDELLPPRASEGVILRGAAVAIIGAEPSMWVYGRLAAVTDLAGAARRS